MSPHEFIRQIVDDRVNKHWCLFVDRDGVINRQIIGDYVRSWPDFEWLPGARAALKILRAWAPSMVVVTNQQGVGKGLMSPDDVATIHNQLRAELAEDAITLDGIQVCPHLQSRHCDCRKPRPGLVLEWLARDPALEPALSIVVGDSQSDMELAQNVAAVAGGCVSIGIGGRPSVTRSADAAFDSLWAFAIAVENAARDNVD